MPFPPREAGSGVSCWEWDITSETRQPSLESWRDVARLRSVSELGSFASTCSWRMQDHRRGGERKSRGANTHNSTVTTRQVPEAQMHDLSMCCLSGIQRTCQISPTPAPASPPVAQQPAGIRESGPGGRGPPHVSPWKHAIKQWRDTLW